MTTFIFENEYVVCELDDSLPVLKHRWKLAVSGDQFKSNLVQIQKHYKTVSAVHKNLAWLADTTLLGELDEETEKWLAEEWQNLLFKDAGVKIHAVILGEDIFADYPMEKFKMEAARKFNQFNVQLEVFSDEEDAYVWIRTR
jgi:hypothetical protein